MEKEQVFFRDVLRCLPFNGIRIKDFAEQINVSPQTIYNYINGQPPSEKACKYVLYIVGKHYPQVIEQAKELQEVNEWVRAVIYQERERELDTFVEQPTDTEDMRKSIAKR